VKKIIALLFFLGLFFIPDSSASIFRASDRTITGTLSSAGTSTILSAPSSTRWITMVSMHYVENNGADVVRVYCGNTIVSVLRRTAGAALINQPMQYECSSAIYGYLSSNDTSTVALTYTDSAPYEVSSGGGGGGGGLVASDLDGIIYGIGILTFIGSAGLILKGFV